MFKRIIMGQLRHLIVTGPLAVWLLQNGISPEEIEKIAQVVIIIISHAWSAWDKVKDAKEQKAEAARIEEETKQMLMMKINERQSQ